MGQPIDAEMRQMLLEMPNVAFVTNDHIGFRDGCIMDPKEVMVREEWVLFIVKFVQCRCGRHTNLVGTHEGIPGVRRTMANRATEQKMTGRPSFCDASGWTTEEVVDCIEVVNGESEVHDVGQIADHVNARMAIRNNGHADVLELLKRRMT